MGDSLRVTEIKITQEQIDSKRDLCSISGVVTVAVEYGETTLSIQFSFADKANPTDAMCAALRHVEHVGHFMEARANVARLEFKCSRS